MYNKNMKLSLSDDSHSFHISSYDEGSFTVNQQLYLGSQIFTADSPPTPWNVAAIEELSLEQLKMDGISKQDLVIIGTGSSLIFPDDKCLSYLYDMQIGFEIMDTPAACRTFNILLSEGRNALAALIAI